LKIGWADFKGFLSTASGEDLCKVGRIGGK